MGFKFTLIADACRGIDPAGVAAQVKAMKDAGVILA
nr:hypothetical protein [Salipiger sp. PrR002]